MTDDERQMFVELSGTAHLYAALFQSLLQAIADRGLIERLQPMDLFGMAEMRLASGPQNEGRMFARTLLRQWRDDGSLYPVPNPRQ